MIPKRVWIDLENTPHVPFFAPIVRELEANGYSVTVTVRDAYQTRELALFWGLKHKCIGRHYGKHKLFKVYGICFRSLQLASTMVWSRPALAISHGSRSQILAAELLRIPSICLEDYEYGAESSLLKPTWLLVPEVLGQVRRGANVLSYPGLKEDVYAPEFEPKPSIKADLGITEDDLLVCIRPPATEAHYHRAASSELFRGTMDMVGSAPDVKIIVLPRNTRQAETLLAEWRVLFSSGKAIIPAHPLDGLNLIWHSDLVISGGGTMNREAAALGVPVYSIFCGEIGAVDRYLEKEGRLVLLHDAEDLKTKLALKRRFKSPPREQSKSLALQSVVAQIVSILEGQLRAASSQSGLSAEVGPLGPSTLLSHGRHARLGKAFEDRERSA